jgi:penicillin amidase
MKWFRRILGATFALAILLPALAVAGGWLWLRTGLPSDGRAIAVDGPSAPVEILRDENAVPHVFAGSDHDAYFALGWLHAEDRLFQMEMQRRVGAGRLAEVIGEAGLRTDRYMRTLGIYRQAETSYDAMAPEIRDALDAYAAGVNAWLAQRPGPLPLEFQVLRFAPEPWRPADSIVWGKLMALQLSGNSRAELRRARLLQRLDPAQVDDLHPAYPDGAPVTLSAALGGLDFERWAGVSLPDLGPDKASNVWVLSADRTATGAPILVNDPHLALNAPILWYLARIEAPGLSLTGATVPGVPFHLLGHNGTIAWGLTTTGTDVQDLFVERLDPADAGRYLTPEGAVPFETREETIRIAGGGEERLTVRSTRHGPVISDVEDAAAGVLPEGHVLSLAFTALSGRDTTAGSLYHVNRARNWDEFRSALRSFIVPQQNFAYADKAGNIGFYTPGLVPVREAGDGTLPSPGWTGEHGWTGFVPFEELPHAYNPPGGSFVNANNRVVGPDYPWLLTTHWDDPFRALRIEERLGTAPPQDLESSEALLADTVDLAARDLLPLLARAETDDPAARDALARLAAWDGRSDRDAAEPLIFNWWLRELNRRLHADELGPLAAEVRGLNPRVVRRMLTERRRWCDDVTTPDVEESCGRVLGASLEATLAALAERHGADPAGWRWGDEHRAPLTNQVIDRIPVLRSLRDLGTETDGSDFTVNRGATRLSDDEAPFAHVHGAGYRAVYDLGAPERSLFVIATGQSGNPLSPHYSDFVERWRDGRHVTITGTPEELAARGIGRLVLSPGRQAR